MKKENTLNQQEETVFTDAPTQNIIAEKEEQDDIIKEDAAEELDEDENSGYSGKFKYMGNKVVGNIGSEVPEYQYRIK